MKDPWKILKLPPTATKEEIKKAYRGLVQQYHPDKVKTPEEKRKYTIRFVEIREAYENALKYHESEPIREDIDSTNAPTWTSYRSPKNKTGWSKWAGVLGIVVGTVVFIYLFAKLGKYSLSLPKDHIFPVLFSGLLGIIIGCFVGFFIAHFLYFPAILLMFILDKLGLEKYIMKVLWILSFILWIVMINVIGIPDTLTRESTHFVTWFTAFGFVPVMGLIYWINDYIKYKKIRGRYMDIIRNAPNDR